MSESIREIPSFWLDDVPLAFQYDDVKLRIVPEQEPDYAALMPGMLVAFIYGLYDDNDPDSISVHTNGAIIGFLFEGRVRDAVTIYWKRDDPMYSFISHVEEGLITITIAFYKSF